MAKIESKVVFLGSASAGKTCLLGRFVHGIFNANTQNTVAGSFAAKTLTIDSCKVVLKLWDTAGNERYASVSRVYYRNATAAIICFDLTDEASYSRTRYWVSELMATEPDCKLYLCGTKKDLLDKGLGHRAVPENTVTDLAEDLQADYFETSSITGENVEFLFETVAKNIVKAHKERKVARRRDMTESIKLSTSWKTDPRVKKAEDSPCCKSQS